MSNIDRYTKFIAEQVKRTHVAGFRDGVINEEHKDDGHWTHNIYDGEMEKHKSLAAAKNHAMDSEEESVIHHVVGGKVQKTHRIKADGDGWESHTENKGKTLDHDDLHEAVAGKRVSEKTAIKHALKDLNSRLGGEIWGPVRTGRGTQMTSPQIDTSHHSKEKVAKALAAAGYKKTGHEKSSISPGNSYDSYEKTDLYGYKHSVKHAHNKDGTHSVNHVGANQ